jgi:hypothetical protein
MAKDYKGISRNAEFDGILVSALVDASFKIAARITDEVDKSLLISYIEQLQKGIRQRDEVVRTLITHIKKLEKTEEKK